VGDAGDGVLVHKTHSKNDNWRTKEAEKSNNIVKVSPWGRMKVLVMAKGFQGGEERSSQKRVEASQADQWKWCEGGRRGCVC